ncbi:MAG TPA: hypothetical protein VF029_02525 [Actinomycetota bacterium]
METSEIVLLSISVVLVVVVVVGAVRAQRASQGPQEPALGPPPADREPVVVLDVAPAEPDNPAVERLVREAAARVYRMMPMAETVEVRSRTGTTLGVVARTRPPDRRLDVPEPVATPHPPRSRAPDLLPHLAEPEEGEPPPGPPQAPVFAPASPSRRRPIAERFDLPEAVREGIGHADDPTALVRAILEASGATVRAEGEVLRVDGYAIMVVIPSGHVIEPGSLDHAYFCIERSGAARGLVIAMGILDVADVRRREALAPHVLHTGPDGIQRMADAVAIGEDPLRFAAGPALATSRPRRREEP